MSGGANDRDRTDASTVHAAESLQGRLAPIHCHHRLQILINYNVNLTSQIACKIYQMRCRAHQANLFEGHLHLWTELRQICKQKANDIRLSHQSIKFRPKNKYQSKWNDKKGEKQRRKESEPHLGDEDALDSRGHRLHQVQERHTAIL